MQGRLRNEYLSVEVETECAHCGKRLNMTLDSELKWSVRQAGAAPLLFEPDVDWKHFQEPNIIGRY